MCVNLSEYICITYENALLTHSYVDAIHYAYAMLIVVFILMNINVNVTYYEMFIMI